MRIVFAGTPEFAAVALERLLGAGHAVPLVFTQPDRPAGRGMRLAPGPVKSLALEAGIAVAQPTTFRNAPEAVAQLRAVPHDVMVVAAYGLILPQSVLDIPPRGCLNIHASLLPRWRGAAPVQRAIAAGDRETGVCIMRMEAGLDTGPVLARRARPIADTDTGGSLTAALAALGADLIVEVLRDLDAHPPQPQDDAAATYAAKIGRDEAPLDFRQRAEALARKVRAFDPVPGAQAACRGQAVKIWAARPGPATEAACGTIVAIDRDGVHVACGEGTGLLLTQLQRPGGKRLPAHAFLQGFPLTPGEAFAIET
ncbi:MAG: methionyl-tRNA formyltransferase [Burkholderiales bacterium]|nr:methionyl-tRNA formyltransferase [Burkholderiales bacterium]